MNPPRVLALSGSARRESVNQALVRYAAGRAGDKGADVTVVSLGDYPLPLYNADEETEFGEPENAKQLKAVFRSHDALLIASPEYNGLITPLFKNTFDWLSRKAGDETTMIAFEGKTAGLLAASFGRLGGLRGLVHARALLTNLGILTVPAQAAIGGARDAFDADGRLARDGDIALVDRVVDAVLAATRRS